jgi:hypothetical protein
MAEAIAKFEQKYGLQIASWAIVAMIVYLVIAQ